MQFRRRRDEKGRGMYVGAAFKIIVQVNLYLEAISYASTISCVTSESIVGFEKKTRTVTMHEIVMNTFQSKTSLIQS